MRDCSNQMSRSDRRRKTASFNEEMLKRPLLEWDDQLSPQVIHSQEDLRPGGSVFQVKL